MNEVTPMMPPGTWAAFERLLEVARADTPQARDAANVLLAWWNAGDLGGFDLTEAWGLDDALKEDLVTLFGFIARHKVYPSAYSFRSEFEDLVRQWRPQVCRAGPDRRSLCSVALSSASRALAIEGLRRSSEHRST
jgi:hypothetical protein